MTPVEIVAFFLIGTLAAIVGSLVGLGGGVLVVPVLRIVFAVSPAGTAGAALVMVFANSLSATVAYVRQRRVDVRAGLFIAATGIPGSIAGAICVHYVSFVDFDLIYSALLIYVATDAIRRSRTHQRAGHSPRKNLGQRVLRDASGKEYRYRENVPVLLVVGVVTGFASSFFGIGGGTIVIPALMFFDVPAHIVTATSQFAIAFTSPVGVATHLLSHDIQWGIALPLAVGGLIGGQIGPRIAKRLSPAQLLIALAVTLIAAALSLILDHASLL
ncbi:MAG TPA: sulfite exporter TauE/SafE family protein [Candidatus Acidoferrales bacterium]|nr:sulfite exporter TauE/SafE family protein [Candidatus Acidoferrales bacterium]